MGKKPLVGLVGLVAAGMLVTAGCGDCCKSRTRTGDTPYKPAPTFGTKNGKTDGGTPHIPTGEKDVVVPPVKPPEPPATLDNKPGPQASLPTPGSAPLDVKALSPNTQGFDKPAPRDDVSAARSAMPLPPPPQSLQRPNTYRDAAPPARPDANLMPASGQSETLPAIGTAPTLPPVSTGGAPSVPPPPAMQPPAMPSGAIAPPSDYNAVPPPPSYPSK